MSSLLIFHPTYVQNQLRRVESFLENPEISTYIVQNQLRRVERINKLPIKLLILPKRNGSKPTKKG